MNLLAVIGNPIAHSLSPKIHQMFADQFGLSISYLKVESPVDGFAATAKGLLDKGAIGFNITVPFKLDAYKLADNLSKQAERAEAVNTIQLLDSGKLRGHNTDGIGLVQDLTHNLNWSLEGSRILILGAGGAVNGILDPILSQKPACIHIANRTYVKAEKLANQYPSEVSAINIAQLSGKYDVVISGTSAGLPVKTENAEVVNNENLWVPENVIDSDTYCYDLIYSHDETPFIQRCRECGAKATADGLGMLVEQAAFAFEIWFGKRPESIPVITELRRTTGND